MQSCRGVQVTRFHPEPSGGKDWADVSIPLYIIHDVVSDRLGTGHLEAFVLRKSFLKGLLDNFRPPLWSSGQSFWLQIQRSRVRFPALPDFSE